MKTKITRILSRVGIVFFVLIVLLLALRAILNYPTGKKLHAFLERAKAEGIPTSLADLAPHCDDTENGALFWKAAEALFILPEADDKTLINATVRDFFDAKPLQEQSSKKLLDLIKNNSKALELILEASSRPCFRYGDWTKRPDWISPPDAVKMIFALRLLGIDAVLQAEAGRVQEALGQVRQGMRFVKKTMDEPFLIHNLLALADMKSLLNCFNQIVRVRDLDSGELKLWIQELDVQSWRTRFLKCVQLERLLASDAGLATIGGDNAALGLFTSRKERFYYWLTRPLWKAQMLWIQQHYQELEAGIDLPYPRLKEFIREKAQQSRPWHGRLSALLLPDFEAAFLKETTLEAMMLATRTGLACKIFKNRNGRYPENLAALVPGILAEMPSDPFTGKPLVYRLQDDGVIIYSVGSNEQDDGGRGTWMITQLVMEKDDDWAWKGK
jgi:hypothetical protein